MPTIYGSSPSSAFARDAHLIAALRQSEDHGERPAKRQRRTSHGALSIPEEDEDAHEAIDGEAEEEEAAVERRLSMASHNGGLFKHAFDPDESTPLLQPPPPLSTGPPADAWKLEARLLVKYSTPILGTHILEFSLLISTIIAVGHLSTNALAAASLAMMTANVTTLSILQGLCTAADTLCSQAAGSERPELAGLHAQRVALIIFAIMPFQIALAWTSKPILLALGQDPEVAHLASRYLRVLSCGYPGYALFEVLRHWLQAQGLMTPPAIAIAIVAPLNIFLQWLLVWGPVHLGFLGAPLATAFSFTAMFAVTSLYCWLYAPRTCWGGFRKEALRNLGPELRLGFAGVLAVSSEWWAFEALSLGASYFGPARLAAQSVLLTTASTTYHLPYALAVGAAVRIGNLLGANQGSLARVTAKTTVFIGLCIGLFNSTLLFAFRGPFGRLFTSDEVVIDIVAQVMPLIALFQIADCASGVAGGVLRGSGRSPTGAVINLIGYYVVGLPLAFGLGFGANLGLEGLWIGITVALGICAVFSVFVAFNIDYEGEAAKAKERMS